MTVVKSGSPIFDQLQIEFLSKKIWRVQLGNLKTSRLRMLARDLGVKRYLIMDRWDLLDAILNQPYETLEKNLYLQ